MTRSDPTYEYFRADAQRHIEDPNSPIETVADYFRYFGIVPPANYGRPAYKDRELAQHDDLERLSETPTHTGRYSIYKSWGEPSPTITTTRNSHDGDADD